MKKIFVIPALLIGALLFSGCMDKETEPWHDAPTSDVRNDDPADIINMPDGFSNLASKCDGPNRVYVAFKGDANRASIFVVANDPRCRG